MALRLLAYTPQLSTIVVHNFMNFDYYGELVDADLTATRCDLGKIHLCITTVPSQCAAHDTETPTVAATLLLAPSQSNAEATYYFSDRWTTVAMLHQSLNAPLAVSYK